MIPSELMYTTHDEWIRRDADVIVIGITAYAQEQLGEIVHVELPEVGEVFDAGAEVCEIESTKTVAEVYTPVAGEVVAVNDELEDDESTVNEDPYGGGWLVKLRVGSDTPMTGLLDAAGYAAKIGE